MEHTLARAALVAALAASLAPSTASADVGIGLFVGEPLGFDLKIDLERRSALDIVLGAASIDDGGRDYSYGHLTYLVTPVVGHGRSARVPLRLGIGAAMYGVVEGDLNLAARVPLELAIAFRRTPLELYGEIALKLNLVRENDAADFVDLDGGVGLRIYL